MTIDCHIYLFPPLDSPAGHPSIEEKMRWVHDGIGLHRQPAWRVRDRAPVDNSKLVDLETGEKRDVEWTRHMGRLAWIYEGETYTKQYIPPMLHNLECPPEVMLAEMDYARVDKAIVHTHPNFGLLNGYLRDAVSPFPDRLMRLVSVKEHEIPGDPDAAIRELQDEFNIQPGAGSGLQFFPDLYYGGGHREPWDNGAMRPFWDAVASLKIPVFFTGLTGRPHNGKPRPQERTERYLEGERILLRLMDRYPDVTVVITHGMRPWERWKLFREPDDPEEFPEAIWDVFKSPKCHTQLLFTISVGGRFEYPWKEVEPAVEELIERVGADHLMWGTDMPMLGRHCTYQQAQDQYRVHCDFLTDSERQDMLGGTAARVMGIDSP